MAKLLGNATAQTAPNNANEINYKKNDKLIHNYFKDKYVTSWV